VIFATCLRPLAGEAPLAESLGAVRVVGDVAPAPAPSRTIENMGYRISRTLASHCFAMGLNATCVLAIGNDFALPAALPFAPPAPELITSLAKKSAMLGVARLNAACADWTGVPERENIDSGRFFRGETPKNPLNPEDVLACMGGASAVDWPSDDALADPGATEDEPEELRFSWIALRTCGSDRTSRESENSKPACSTLSSVHRPLDPERRD